jgi:isocitrate dehydrogenase
VTYRHIQVPAGERITGGDGGLVVPDSPIVGWIEGDGIGPEVMGASRRVWDAAIAEAYDGARRIAWMELFAGEKAAQLYEGDVLPEETIAALREFVVAIKGPLTTPVGGGFRSLNVRLRQELDLYACIRPVRWYEGTPSPCRRPEGINLVIFRENTEDVYAGIEYESGSPEAVRIETFLSNVLGADLRPGSGLGIKPMSEFASKRLVRKAIRYALARGLRNVTLVHKGNIQKYTEGAFRNWGYELAREEFGDVTITEDELNDRFGGSRPPGKLMIQDRIADAMFQHLLLRPQEFDVLATTNLHGDYLSDAAAALVGGLGVAPGANVGDRAALFEATHGAAPDIAGRNVANPASMLLSGVMLLDHIGWSEAARSIERAYLRTIGQGIVTVDLAMAGATVVGTSDMATALIRNLRTRE